MHNSPKSNLEFKLSFTETNLRWLLGEPVRNEKAIEQTRNKIAQIIKELGGK